MFEKHTRCEPFMKSVKGEETILRFKNDKKEEKGELTKRGCIWTYRTPWDNEQIWTANQLRQIADKIDELNRKSRLSGKGE